MWFMTALLTFEFWDFHAEELGKMGMENMSSFLSRRKISVFRKICHHDLEDDLEEKRKHIGKDMVTSNGI